jgi:hypothetical protein
MLNEKLAAEKEERLQLFRQLYERCRDQRGENDERTRMLLELISQVEEQPANGSELNPAPTRSHPTPREIDLRKTTG